MNMKLRDAIEDLEAREAFLDKTCVVYWDPAINTALKALKEKADFADDPLKGISYWLTRLWMKSDSIDTVFMNEIISQIEERIHDKG